MVISEKTIFAYALDNAIRHEGKAVQGAVLSGLFAEGLEKSQVKEFLPKISQVIQEISKMSLQEQKDLFKEYESLLSKREIREGLPPLPNAVKGKVVMRFAPFPSGPLHIGNTRQLVLNSAYVEEYKGKLLLVIDDTIGSEAKPIEPEAYKLIEDGVMSLSIPFEGPIYKSDRMEEYYKYAKKLLDKDLLYVCDCDRDTMRKLREEGIECSCRAYPVDIQKKRWEELFKAKEGEMCARIKTNMQDPDPAFRDRVMFRVSDRPHPRIKTKYRVYPLLDFSWAIDDHLLGITHILRGIDLVMETKVERFIWDLFGWKHPEVIHTGFFEIEGIKLSKSKGASEVRSGKYSGWNDPRTWSLQSLHDRGIQADSIKEFIINMSATKTNTKVPVESLYAINRKNLNDVKRYFFVEKPQKISVKNAPHLTAKLPFHPDGTKGYREYETSEELYISESDFKSFSNKNYRCMHLFNFKTEKNDKGKLSHTFISEEPDKKLACSFLHWLPGNTDNITIEVRMPDNTIITGLGEPALTKLKIGSIVQFERFGFVRLHKRFDDKLEFWFAHK